MIDLKNLNRRHFMGLAGMTAAASMMPWTLRQAAAAAPLPAVKEEEAVIGFGHVGPISDEGWTYSHHQGLLAVKDAFPKAKYLEVENIPFSADVTRIYRQMVSDGANMIFSTSNYGDLLYEVSDRSPDVGWFECDGRRPADNLSGYYIQHWYPTYVVGVAAGLLSKTGKLGYVASFPVPSVFSGTNAFLMGARSVNPNATLQAVVINSWFDPQGAKQAGTALIDNGADFLFGIMDEAAYLQVAEERGVWAAMWNTDIRRYGPKSYVSSIVLDWREFYVEQVKKRLAGEWAGGEEILLPMGKGIDRDAWGENVPADVAAKADAVRTKMLTEGWSPFVGEIKDAEGTVRVPAGHKMTEQELYNWDWSIEGVSGLKV
ncbi:BMP family ABC transporter substrate-binding protein [Kaistia algarum]|uniref:BMP family ABC transporter substrate-binding protein n=1 Tax=Kaistia algarum TaxID=2083279 RepID=UPI000CE75FF8|nr:BMP family ABC transporter substrate-binding protein [Kaistia algarum]MCX5516551.1 BMP family ABC transporter substrate-binding protein [Kaistia algarum]PPE78337.1 BMP family ABC transporter substrate-binding protein [Kaistia algarum]